MIFCIKSITQPVDAPKSGQTDSSHLWLSYWWQGRSPQSQWPRRLGRTEKIWRKIRIQLSTLILIQKPKTPIICSWVKREHFPRPRGLCQCGVCEDLHGVQAIFKSTVIEDLAYVCRADGKCLITKKTRNWYQFCRFNKCLKLGSLVHFNAHSVYMFTFR